MPLKSMLSFKSVSMSTIEYDVHSCPWMHMRKRIAHQYHGCCRPDNTILQEEVIVDARVYAQALRRNVLHLEHNEAVQLYCALRSFLQMPYNI